MKSNKRATRGGRVVPRRTEEAKGKKDRAARGRSNMLGVEGGKAQASGIVLGYDFPDDLIQLHTFSAPAPDRFVEVEVSILCKLLPGHLKRST